MQGLEYTLYHPLTTGGGVSPCVNMGDLLGIGKISQGLDGLICALGINDDQFNFHLFRENTFDIDGGDLPYFYPFF